VRISALSLTSNVVDWLSITRQPRIMHVFDHACNLINEHREVLSVVTSNIGNGPFNLVVDDGVLFSQYLDVESPVSIFEGRLKIGDLTIIMKDVKLWNPRPNWKNLHDRRGDVAQQLTQLQNIQSPISTPPFSPSLLASIAIADISASLTAAQKITGLGMGLTPSSDDFIVGAIYAAWIIHPVEVAGNLAREIADTVSGLTTSLSGAWIRSTIKGEVGILWHDFFASLIGGDESNIQLHMTRILSVGETSGADALLGFLGVFRNLKDV